ncbi:YigZ family protein [Methylomarinum sp. Ch1-1]|uniref:YigZ family protein n=1 Tax=Methylomarinum roseum TaxID=3067653 RepID=A0AAU7NZ88_9GAMM|nr:YigZ family protein [Methylomarinum sp. Ch1-1]MDP4521634.1 YigZ family protein [Methylomarinum sp. Ch1-1]
MKTVSETAIIEETIKKSRFIAAMNPCQSEAQAHAILRELHQQHPNANHIVFAYRINSDKGLLCRFHDAGEPSGTAGKPIFHHLEGKQLINVMIVVVRYFGGIKLGAGGLARAYGNSARQAIEAAELKDYVKMAEVTLALEYSQMKHLEYQLKKLDGKIIAQDYSDKIRVKLSLPAENVQILKDLTL